MSLLYDVLATGYMPRELPPAFSTEVYAAALVSNLTSLPSSFRQPGWVRPGTFTFAKSSGLRRRLTIANPIHFFNLAELIETEWTSIGAHVASSPLSLSCPTADPKGVRALVPATHAQDLISNRAKSRARGKYTLLADISEFYPSIYTHTIPWALHGKSFAKANLHNVTLLGNRLDKLVRIGQEGQTVGIPIGPDTSLVIAELVLAAIDIVLGAGISGHAGFRWMNTK